MTKPIEATFDGTVFRPSEPVPLAPNTHVRITVETSSPPTAEQASFLRTARSLNLDGPPDWASNLHQYLYGNGAGDAE